MAIPLSEQLESRIGQRTSIKRDKSGKRIGGGTRITKKLVSEVRGDESVSLIIAEDNREQIANAINSAFAAALEEIGLAAERFAKRACPVDTGRLRNSITHALSMDENAVYIGTNVRYAPYVEFGTHRVKARPFLRPAANDHTSYYQNIIKKHMENA